MRLRSLQCLWMIVLATGVQAQKTTDFSGSPVIGILPEEPYKNSITVIGTALLSGVGEAAIRLRLTQEFTPNFWGKGPGSATVVVAVNRVDGFEISFDFADPGANLQYEGTGTIGKGRGAYAGATGTATVRFVVPDAQNNRLQGTLSISGSMTVNGSSVSMNVSNAGMLGANIASIATQNYTPGTGSLGALGNATVTLLKTADASTNAQQTTFTIRLNANDSFPDHLALQGATPSVFTEAITNGTGAFDGATGTVKIQPGPGAGGVALNISGQVTQPRRRGTHHPRSEHDG